MCILFYFSFVCLYVYAYYFKSKVHCISALRLGASGLPYYCKHMFLPAKLLDHFLRSNKRNVNQLHHLYAFLM